MNLTFDEPVRICAKEPFYFIDCVKCPVENRESAETMNPAFVFLEMLIPKQQNQKKK